VVPGGWRTATYLLLCLYLDCQERCDERWRELVRQSYMDLCCATHCRRRSHGENPFCGLGYVKFARSPAPGARKAYTSKPRWSERQGMPRVDSLRSPWRVTGLYRPPCLESETTALRNPDSRLKQQAGRSGTRLYERFLVHSRDLYRAGGGMSMAAS
jgi:hypothetical protein